MRKKTYIQPDINVVILQQQHQLLNVSGVTTSSPSSDVNLSYKNEGDDPDKAW